MDPLAGDAINLEDAEAREQRLYQANRDASYVHYDNEIWLRTPVPKGISTRRTSLITDPPNGRIPPPTAEAEQRAAARAEARRQRGPFDGYEVRPLSERCVVWPHNGPPMLPPAYNDIHQFLQTPGYVVLHTELSNSLPRIIPAISEFPKGRKYLISLSFLGKSSVRPAQVGRFDVNIVIHGSTAVRGRGDLVAIRMGPVEAAGAVDAQNAPTAPRKTLRVFHELPQGLSHQIIHGKPRKTPKGPKIALGNPDRPIIPMDGRPPLPDDIQMIPGDSRGRWEGDTLVVESGNFTDKTRFQGSTAALHVVERFTRVSEDMIRYEFTVDDPTSWTQPWSAEIPMLKTDGPMFEYACHEGNYDVRHILEVYRNLEKQAAAGAR